MIQRALTLVVSAFLLVSPASAKGLDAGTAGSGLKEALSLGTGKAVDILGVKDGFLGNKEVRIGMPESLRSAEKVLRAVGQGAMVDEFETSMNRAAEAAVPVAKKVFLDSVKEMSFDDALKILSGSDHSATDYLKEHAGPRLSELFQPIVHQQLDAVGCTQSFNAMTSKVQSLPFGGALPAFDLDHYVTGKALDGLFVMVAKEEKNIRTNVVGRTTSLLQEVFGSKEAKKALGTGKSEEKKPDAAGKDPLKSIEDILKKP
jgi:hypothetical protein